jgi:G8 domain-containing protein
MDAAIQWVTRSAGCLALVGLLAPGAGSAAEVQESGKPHEHHHPPVTLKTRAVGDAAAGPIKTAKDTVPDFAGEPTITSKQSGPWFSPATWAGGRIPGVQDVVKVAAGHTVRYAGTSDIALAALGIEGTLTFDAAATTRLKVGTIVVYRTGQLHLGTQAKPVTARAELTVADRPLAVEAPDPQTKTLDPLRFGTGLLAFGEVLVHGARKSPTWVRLAREPRAGDTTLQLEAAPTGWNAGDRLVLPDTRQTSLEHQGSGNPPKPIALQIEEPTITSIRGKRVTLTAPLQFDHLGGRDTAGAVVALPHVGNLTRNVVVRSESPGGTRGHLLFTERARVNIHYAAFESLGRTTAAPLGGANQIGRYPVHFHHLMGPRNPSNSGYQFVFVGNSVVDALKWGVTVHNSHYGLVSDNVVYRAEGAGILTEQGNETENVIEKNFVVRTGTPIAGWYNPTYGGVAGDGRRLGFGDFGWEGSALWFTGNDNYVRNNVAANASYAGVMYNGRSSGGYAFNHPVVPRHRGADIASPAEWTSYLGKPAPAVRESAGNEVYASALGTWIGFSGAVGELKNFLHWNIRQQGVYAGRNASVTLDGFTIVSDQQVSNANVPQVNNHGMDFGANIYTSGGITVRNSRVEGFNIGITLPTNNALISKRLWPDVPPATILDKLHLRNYVNLLESSARVPKHTLLRDVTFVQNPAPARRGLSPQPAAIVSQVEPNRHDANIAVLSRMLIFNYNKTGKNLEFFFPEQAPDYVMPPRAYPAGVLNPKANCPTQGLTNRECWEKHGVATLGRLASCPDTATYPEIRGFACPLASKGGGTSDPGTSFEGVLAGLAGTSQ